jgi:rhamnopyranosyl-N-acetylglucosaminyl-diphospho-decaprenol beta-1,3/1,4-galactofuranosyltransferase
MKIIAAVVTFNRLPILKECVDALRNQMHKPDVILVINNDSTDGTTEWLAMQQDVQTIKQANLGGAYGFYTAIKEGYKLGADWVWVMDDDTIPSATALAELTQGVELTRDAKDEFGFFCSRVLWTDGALHNANMVYADPRKKWKSSFEEYLDKGVQLVPNSTFVSVMISRTAIKKTGLPLKEMFIWYDDIEYTQRITNNGFAGALMPKSIVVHKTPDNHTNDLYTDDAGKIWKHRYGMRNQLYFRRFNKGYGSFLRHVFKRITVMSFKMFTKRKHHRLAYAKMIWSSSLEALSFNPPIEYVED